MPPPGRLTARRPALGAEELASRFHPPRRFGHVRFDTFVPNPAHPSQASARAEMESFVDEVVASASVPRRRWGRGRAEADRTAAGRYLDGGFGVGKTHLLAAAWHAAPFPKAYLTFAELTAVIGFLGMEAAVGAFSGYRLLCIDEFELDDVANTLMTVTFLRSVIPQGVRVAATSNSLPDRLGEGRFSAEDFTREIAAIASWFEVVRIDGPDYRGTAPESSVALAPPAADALVAQSAGAATDDGFGAVLAHLRRVHPVQLGALVDGIDTVVVRDVAPVADQGAALAWVALVDELYDAGVTFGMTGCAVGEVFDASYRHGGYRKKYGRCESRLAAMLGEACARLSSP
ncbi:MAG TPA: cell division protein ZapE [Acidimicrobiales bacterium]|nr:cell division protein ZapE [Acidimicrobiales bacterium]